MGICPPSGVGAFIICIMTPKTTPPTRPDTMPLLTSERMIVPPFQLFCGRETEYWLSDMARKKLPTAVPPTRPRNRRRESVMKPPLLITEYVPGKFPVSIFPQTVCFILTFYPLLDTPGPAP